MQLFSGFGIYRAILLQLCSINALADQNIFSPILSWLFSLVTVCINVSSFMLLQTVPFK